MKKKLPAYEVSSGNVFADLGLPNPERYLTKSKLAQRIATVIERRGLTQVQAAKVLGVSQSKVSNLFRGKLSGVSLEKLILFLNALDHDVEIVIRSKPKSRKCAKTKVVAV